jgi:hypothetical protein
MFLGLMLDNVAELGLTAGLLAAPFEFPTTHQACSMLFEPSNWVELRI